MGKVLAAALVFALAFLSGGLWLCQRDEVRQIDELRRECADAKRREAQLREFVVRHALPRRMIAVTNAADARALAEWQLNPESLEWEPARNYFGVDRSKLRQPGRTGDVAGDVGDP
jgi:hypothetical protein